jgi:hypothetical protein
MLTELHLGISSGENDPPQSCDVVKAQNVLICFTEDRNNVKDMNKHSKPINYFYYNFLIT